MPVATRLGDMRIFLEILRHGSYVAAARELRLSQPSLSRRMSDMEQQLGVRLLNRDTKRLSLTEAGERWRDHAERILGALSEAEDDIATGAEGPRGRLRVAAPASFGRRAVAPVVSGFLRAHPAVTVDLVLNDAYSDIVREGFDVALRIGALADSRMIVRRLAPNRRRLVAAPAYVAARAAPAHPGELPSHHCLEFTPLASGDVWHFDGPGGAATSARVFGRVRSNNAEVLLQACLDGHGIALQPDFLVAEHLRAGRLVELLPDWQPRSTDIHAVWPSRRHTPVKVSAFVAWCVEAWREPPWERGAATP